MVQEARLPADTLPAPPAPSALLSPTQPQPTPSHGSSKKKLSVTLRKSSSVFASTEESCDEPVTVSTVGTPHARDPITRQPADAADVPIKPARSTPVAYQKEFDLLMAGVGSTPKPKPSNKRSRESPSATRATPSMTPEVADRKRSRVVSKTPAPQAPPQPTRPDTSATSLHRIITGYLQDRHKSCKYPCATLPTLPLDPIVSHACPLPRPSLPHMPFIQRILNSQVHLPICM